ncbi:hypothetical protein EBZ80_22840 [bacterium]|nr:hypothetical protein [bacterium]
MASEPNQQRLGCAIVEETHVFRVDRVEIHVIKISIREGSHIEEAARDEQSGGESGGQRPKHRLAGDLEKDVEPVERCQESFQDLDGLRQRVLPIVDLVPFDVEEEPPAAVAEMMETLNEDGELGGIIQGYLTLKQDFELEASLREHLLDDSYGLVGIGSQIRCMGELNPSVSSSCQTIPPFSHFYPNSLSRSCLIY